MAKHTKLDIVVDNKQAIPAIEETGKAVVELKEKSVGASKGTKKDWGGVADLFSSVLPRSLTKAMRSFKSTGRQVGRLSKSFKGLKGAIASTGIGLLIIGLGEVAANWEAIAEALWGVTEEEKRLKKEQEEVNKVVAQSKADLDRYKATVLDTTKADEERTDALKELGKTIVEVKDLDINDVETLDKVTDAYNNHERQIKLITQNKSDQLILDEKMLILENDSIELSDDELANARLRGIGNSKEQQDKIE